MGKILKIVRSRICAARRSSESRKRTAPSQAQEDPVSQGCLRNISQTTFFPSSCVLGFVIVRKGMSRPAHARPPVFSLIYGLSRNETNSLARFLFVYGCTCAIRTRAP